jgi:hypothetical protein
MHTCDDCIFCHYRKLRIAAFNAAASALPGREDYAVAGPIPAPQMTKPARSTDRDSVDPVQAR